MFHPAILRWLAIEDATPALSSFGLKLTKAVLLLKAIKFWVGIAAIRPKVLPASARLFTSVRQTRKKSARLTLSAPICLCGCSTADSRG